MYPSVSMIWLYMQVWTAAHIRLYQHILYRLASKFWTHWSNAVFSCLCLHCWCHFCLLSSLSFLSKSFQCHSFMFIIICLKIIISMPIGDVSCMKIYNISPWLVFVFISLMCLFCSVSIVRSWPR
jgi:hypothetical protein